MTDKLLILPDRRALFDEGADAFLGVARHHVLDHHLCRIAIGAGKAHFGLAVEGGLAEAYRYAAEVMTENMMARDAEEGIDAFIEKREPKWQDH